MWRCGAAFWPAAASTVGSTRSRPRFCSGSEIGAPFRQDLLSGVLAPNFPADQLVIFANALQMRPGILSAIREKLAVPIPGGSKRTLLFIWAAGMIDGDGGSGVLDGVGPGRLLGMGLRRGPGELPRTSEALRSEERR